MPGETTAENVIHAIDNESGRRLTAWVRTMGEDLVIAIGGGDRPHVGCVVLAVPFPRREGDGFSPSCSMLTIPPHKEEPIARVVAETVCRRLGRVTVVTAGVHEDAIDLQGIEIYLRLGKVLASKTVDVLRRP